MFIPQVNATRTYYLQIPLILFCSPSPDPNHPDYPEFFEDRLYLESSRNLSSSTEESNVGGSVGQENSSREAVMETDSSPFKVRATFELPLLSLVGMVVGTILCI